MKQFSRFFAVGLFNTLVGYVVIFVCMYWVGLAPEISNIAGYAVGLAISYVLNRNYTFNSRQTRRSELVRFLAVFGIAYSANLVMLLVLIHGLGVHKALAQILAGAVYVAISYLMNKYYVFKTAGTS